VRATGSRTIEYPPNNVTACNGPEEGIEGDRSTVKVETLDGKAVKWTFEEPANLEKR
jgi:hypothetical protein